MISKELELIYDYYHKFILWIFIMILDNGSILQRNKLSKNIFLKIFTKYFIFQNVRKYIYVYIILIFINFENYYWDIVLLQFILYNYIINSEYNFYIKKWNYSSIMLMNRFYFFSKILFKLS